MSLTSGMGLSYTPDMGEIINLRRARKARDRAAAARVADANRAAFGRTKADRAADDAARERIVRTLDGAKLDPPAGD